MPDPLEDALGGGEPEPSDTDSGTPEGAPSDFSQHPVVQTRFGGNVQAALDAYDHLDREYGQQGQRLGQQVQALEQQLAMLQERQYVEEEPEPTGGYDQNGLPDMSVEQLREWFDENPAEAAAYLVAQGNQMAMAQLNAELDKRLKPVEVNVGRATASNLVDGLKKSLGDEMVARNADVLVGLQKTDPDFFKADPQIVFQRMKTAVLAADYERGGQRRPPNGGATADVAVMGGSGGRNPQAHDEPPDPAAEFLAAMTDPESGKRDIVGNPIRSR